MVRVDSPIKTGGLVWIRLQNGYGLWLKWSTKPGRCFKFKLLRPPTDLPIPVWLKKKPYTNG